MCISRCRIGCSCIIGPPTDHYIYSVITFIIASYPILIRRLIYLNYLVIDNAMRRQQSRRARTAHRNRKSRKVRRNHTGGGSHKRRRSAPRSSRRVQRNDEEKGRRTRARSEDEPIRREQTRRINRRRSPSSYDDDTGTWSDDDSSWSRDERPPKEFCGILMISAVGCLICCPITGLLAIYYSWTAKESWDRRYYDESDLKYSNAKTWNFIT